MVPCPLFDAPQAVEPARSAEYLTPLVPTLSG